MILRIVAPHFVAAVEPGQRAAPIISYMLRWSENRIRAYCRTKGWKVEELPENGCKTGRERIDCEQK